MNMKLCLFMVHNFSIDIIAELLINTEVCKTCISIGLNILTLWKTWEQDLYNSERGNYRHEFWIFMDELGFQFWTHGMVKDRPAPGSQNPPYIWHMAALSRLSHLILFSHFANHSRKVVAQELLLIPIFVLKWYSATTCILYDILIICNWLYVFLTFFSTICMILWLSF